MTFMELAKRRYSERYFGPEPVEDDKPKFCIKCGGRVDPGTGICPRCGVEPSFAVGTDPVTILLYRIGTRNATPKGKRSPGKRRGTLLYSRTVVRGALS